MYNVYVIFFETVKTMKTNKVLSFASLMCAMFPLSSNDMPVFKSSVVNVNQIESTQDFGFVKAFAKEKKVADDTYEIERTNLYKKHKEVNKNYKFQNGKTVDQCLTLLKQMISSNVIKRTAVLEQGTKSYTTEEKIFWVMQALVQRAKYDANLSNDIYLVRSVDKALKYIFSNKSLEFSKQIVYWDIETQELIKKESQLWANILFDCFSNAIERYITIDTKRPDTFYIVNDASELLKENRFSEFLQKAAESNAKTNICFLGNVLSKEVQSLIDEIDKEQQYNIGFKMFAIPNKEDLSKKNADKLETFAIENAAACPLVQFGGLHCQKAPVSQTGITSPNLISYSVQNSVFTYPSSIAVTAFTDLTKTDYTRPKNFEQSIAKVWSPGKQAAVLFKEDCGQNENLKRLQQSLARHFKVCIPVQVKTNTKKTELNGKNEKNAVVTVPQGKISCIELYDDKIAGITYI